MKEKLKDIQKLFYILFANFVISSVVIFIVKKYIGVEDVLSISSKITMIAMILMLVLILVAYSIYDFLAKKSKKIEDNTEMQLELFKKAMRIKMLMFDAVGFLTAVLMMLIYQKTYVYMLGIIGVFFVISFPSEIRFKRDFVGRKNIF
jgi:hypothetical protein